MNVLGKFQLRLNHFRQIVEFVLSHPLVKDKFITALWRFCSFQILGRIRGEPLEIMWIEDAFISVSPGESGLTGNIYTGFSEFEEMLFLLHALDREDTFVDIGANLGAYTILASKVVGARSIAFEPVAKTLERLEAQVRLNRIEELVTIVRKAVADYLHLVNVSNSRGTTNRVVLDHESEKKDRVEATTLDIEVTGEGPYFLKVDVEGYEQFVINGGTNLLHSGKVLALILEMNGSGRRYDLTDETLHQTIIDCGFVPVQYDPFSRSLIKIKSRNVKGENQIYVKDIERLARRCVSAPVRHLHYGRGITI